jgi:molybdopterin-containing oxidoreductase family iron-sulfur binding subunit
MSLSRRRFLEIMTAAGVTLPAGHWLLGQLEAYAAERLAYQDVRGPGLTTFSRSVCRDCANHCSLAVRRVDTLPVGIRGTPWHPTSQGGLCPAGQSQMQALFDPDRLRAPLVRDDAGGPGTPVDWDSAITTLDKWVGLLVRQGAGKRIAVVDGRTPSLGTLMLQSWVHSIPGARYIPLRIESAMDRLLRRFLGGGPGGRLRFDLEHAPMLLAVGAEILEVDGSPCSQMRAHGERRESRVLGNAPTVYLGPRQGPTAVKADLWIPCHPGKERDVLLGLAETLSRKHPRRTAILGEYARWIPEARNPVEFARKYSLETVAQRLALNLEDLENVLRAFDDFGAAVILPGPGILRRLNGAADAQAALALNLWTRGFREEGGLSWGEDPLQEVGGNLGLEPGAEENPQGLIDILQPLLEIKRSPVDVLISVEANVVHEFPGRDQIARALSHVPFVAYFAAHEDETSQVAHVTFPTLLSAESWDLPGPAWGNPEPAMQVQRPALVPVVEGRSVEDVIFALASKGAAGKDAKGLVEAAVAAIVETGRGRLVASDGSNPLSGVDAGKARRALLGGEAAWLAESGKSAGGSPEAVKVKAPPPPLVDLAPGQLWLVPFDAPAIQGGRVLNRPMMMELSGLWHGIAWESWIEIHPHDAARLGVGGGDRVRVRGPRAEILCRAVVTASVTPGAAAAPVGFGHRAMGRIAKGQGASILELPNTTVDEETGAPAWGPVPIFVDKV